MRIGVVGASGQLGGEVLAGLLDRGFRPEDVVACVRSPEKMTAWADRGVESRRADYDDPDSMKVAFEGLHRVLLIPSKAPPAPRVQQYENAIGAAREAGVGHLLHFGIVPTSLESISMLAPFLLYAESALRTSGLDWTILRNAIYADPIADWVPEIVEMGTIPYPTGDGRCSFVTRADIASAAAGALTTDGHENRVYQLTGPRALSTADLCEAVARVTDRPVEHRPATDEDYVEVCRRSNEPEFIVRVLLSLYHAIREGEADVVTDDVEILSGRPAEDFEDFLRRRVAQE